MCPSGRIGLGRGLITVGRVWKRLVAHTRWSRSGIELTVDEVAGLRLLWLWLVKVRRVQQNGRENLPEHQGSTRTAVLVGLQYRQEPEDDDPDIVHG